MKKANLVVFNMKCVVVEWVGVNPLDFRGKVGPCPYILPLHPGDAWSLMTPLSMKGGGDPVSDKHSTQEN